MCEGVQCDYMAVAAKVLFSLIISIFTIQWGGFPVVVSKPVSRICLQITFYNKELCPSIKIEAMSPSILVQGATNKHQSNTQLKHSRHKRWRVSNVVSDEKALQDKFGILGFINIINLTLFDGSGEDKSCKIVRHKVETAVYWAETSRLFVIGEGLWHKWDVVLSLAAG